MDYAGSIQKSEAMRDSPILGGLRTIEESQKELWDRLMKLRVMLEPVTRQVDTPSLDGPEEKPVQNASPLYVQLQNIHTQMRFMNDMVHTMIHGLDV